MNENNTIIKRALISVSDKTGIVDFARQLIEMNIEIISTGGTSQLLKEANIPTIDIKDVTNFPEIMDGRVKTLHPKIHGGILGKREEHAEIAKEHAIDWIDLVVVNLYPFSETIQKTNCTLVEAIENIDIGGPTLLRAAAKNMEWVSVIVDPADYDILLAELRKQQSVSFAYRKHLAKKAFMYTASYDAMIQHYLHQTEHATAPEFLLVAYKKQTDLRYGENPHQSASAYQSVLHTAGVLSAKQHQGKLLSYNNIIDANAAMACVAEFTQPACVIVKHANPCGVASANTIEEAFQNAYAADPKSAFGGIIALNRPCDKTISEALKNLFVEVILAPEFSHEALADFAKKPNLRVLKINPEQAKTSKHELKFVEGGLLLQDKNHGQIHQNQLKIVTRRHPDPEQWLSVQFAWQVLKHLNSNAILLVKDTATIGIGAGQVSRIDAVELALRKAGNVIRNTLLASDAFFPFRDSVDTIAKFSASGAQGVTTIIQPGGSINDEEVIEACNEHGIAMIFTGQRCFKH